MKDKRERAKRRAMLDQWEGRWKQECLKKLRVKKSLYLFDKALLMAKQIGLGVWRRRLRAERVQEEMVQEFQRRRDERRKMLRRWKEAFRGRILGRL